MDVFRDRGFLGIVVDPQGYRNITYLVLDLPLGNAKVAFPVTEGCP